MTDEVQYVDRHGDLLKKLESSHTPNRDEWVLLSEEEYQVYHVSHTVVGDDHIATIHCWQPDTGDSDEWSDHRKQMIEGTLEAHARTERDRRLNEDTDRQEGTRC